MTSLRSIARSITKQKDWYVELDGEIIAGSFRTRREARHKVFQLARAAKDQDPWGHMYLVDREYPRFYAVVTDLSVYHVALGSSFCDQGNELTGALLTYQKRDSL